MKKQQFIHFFIFSIILTISLKAQIPTKIMNRADSLLKIKLGNEYFLKTKFNCEATSRFTAYGLWQLCPEDTNYINNMTRKEKKHFDKFIRNYKFPYYWFVYNIDLNLYQNYRIVFCLDTLGNLFNKRKIELPDTTNRYELYTLKIDSLAAKNIAKNYGFNKGIKPWDISFVFLNNRFFWKVKNTLQIDNGEIIFIDAITGEISERDTATWQRVTVY
jgi:hypothetical protein